MKETPKRAITVKEARIEANKSQEACARFLNIALTSFRRKEKIDKFWAHELAALAPFLGVKIEDFHVFKCHKKTQNIDAS